MKCPVCNKQMKLDEFGNDVWYICYNKECRDVLCKEIRPNTPFVAICYGCRKNE